jgi:hypothetical protein
MSQRNIYCYHLRALLPSIRDTTLFITTPCNDLKIVTNRSSQSNYLRRKVARIIANPVVAVEKKNSQRCAYLRREFVRNQC